MSDDVAPDRGIDQPRIEAAVSEILAAIGEDPTREGLIDTPRRVAEAYAYLFAGLSEDPKRHLEVGFSEEYRDLLLIRDIPFGALCEHHLLPMVGKAHVGYVPRGRIVGLSKLARLVEGYARRPQLQERLSTQIADALYEELGSSGSIVVIEASHSCMTLRGVQKPGSVTVTAVVRGVLEEPERRAEAMALISRGKPSL